MFLRFSNSICLALLVVVATAGGADLVLLDRVAPTSGVVRVSDVAAILNAGPEEIDALGRIPLMPAPPRGQQQTVRAQSIRELLAAHGLDLTKVRFGGAAQTVIASPVVAAEIAAPRPVEPLQESTAEPQAAPAQIGFRAGATAAPAARSYVPGPRRVYVSNTRRQALEDELTRRLTEFVQAETGDGMLTVTEVQLKQHNAQTLAANRGELMIRPSTELRVGRQRFLVAFDLPNGPVKFPVVASIVEARPAVLVRRDTPRGTIITAADVHVGPLPKDYRPRGAESLAFDLADVIGKEAVQTLRVGDVVTDGNCLPPVVVERNSVVSVSAGRGAIRVRTQVKARRDGRIGEIIEVESLDTRERFEARVIGRGRLAVLSIGGAAAEALAQDVDALRLR